MSTTRMPAAEITRGTTLLIDGGAHIVDAVVHDDSDGIRVETETVTGNVGEHPVFWFESDDPVTVANAH